MSPRLPILPGKRYVPKMMRYVLAVTTHDSSRIIRQHASRIACQSLAFLVTMGEMKTPKKTDALLIEYDGNGSEKFKENRKSEMDMMIKGLRKDREMGKNEAIS